MSIAAIVALLALTAAALSLLPESPFNILVSYINNMPYLANLNWFIPIAEMVSIGQVWLGAITTVYVVQAALRWIKAIE